METAEMWWERVEGGLVEVFPAEVLVEVLAEVDLAEAQQEVVLAKAMVEVMAVAALDQPKGAPALGAWPAGSCSRWQGPPV